MDFKDADNIVLKEEFKENQFSYKDFHFHCEECYTQFTDFNWFAKHVAEHRQQQNEFGNEPLKEEDNINVCITLLSHTKQLIRTMKSALKILRSEKSGSKYKPDKDLQSKFR